MRQPFAGHARAWQLFFVTMAIATALWGVRRAHALEILTESSNDWGYLRKTILIAPEDFSRDYLWELSALEMTAFASGKQKLIVLRVLTEKRYPLMGVRTAHHLSNTSWLKGHLEQYSDKSARAMFIAFKEGGIGWMIRYADGRIEKDVMGGDPWVVGAGETAGEITYVGHNGAMAIPDEGEKVALDEKGRLKRKYYPMFFVMQRRGLDFAAAESYNKMLRDRLGERNYSLFVSDNEWNPHLVGYPYLNPFAQTSGPPPSALLEQGRYVTCAGVWPADQSCSILEMTNSPR